MAAAGELVAGLAGFVLLAWGVGELWLSIIGSSEADAMRTLAQGRSQALIEVARIVTWAGSAFLLVPLAAVCCLWLVRAGLRREALAVALSLAGAMLISYLVKGLVGRPRPPVEHLQAVTGSSFPSGHATQAGAFWTSLVLVARVRLPAGRARSASAALAALAALVILVVAWSRVYLGVHYPSDVLAGVLLGSGWALYVAWRLARAAPRAGSSEGDRVRAEGT
jgi:undecaprenyl-diphosphatase